MIRTVWFYLMLVVSSFVHAATVIVAALVGVKRRPGGRGIYDWGTTDWARDRLGAVRGEAGAREDPARRARDGDCGPRRDRPAAPAARRRGVRARGSGHQRRRVGRGVPRGEHHGRHAAFD